MQNGLEVWNAKCSAVIAETCHRIGFIELVDDALEWDEKQTALSPGTALFAFLVNILVDRKAMYKLSAFYSRMDMEVLFPQPVSAEQINDDVVGRALVKLQAAGGYKVFSELAMKIVQTYRIPLGNLHVDTTSKSVQGVYAPGEIEEAIAVTFGFSKDERPDLRQIMFGIGTTSEGVLLLGDVMSGNTSDKTWNGHAMEYIQKNWTPELLKQIVWVADSAFVTLANLARAADSEHPIRFISRAPRTLGITDKLVERAFSEDQWEEVGTLAERKICASYRVRSYPTEIDGIYYRCIVTQSSSQNELAVKKIQREVEKELKELEISSKKHLLPSYACETDAQQAGEEFVTRNRTTFHSLQFAVEPVEVQEKRARRGRPGKDEAPPTTRMEYRTVIHIADPGADCIRLAISKESAFVLITNIMDDTDYTDVRILQEYKKQQAPENTFRFLKDPAFVNAIFLKDPVRVEALGYLMLMAALIMSLIQRQVRQALASQQETLTVPGNRPVKNPTASSMLEMLDDVNVIRMTLPNGVLTRMIPDNGIPKQVQKLLELLGYSPTIFTQSRWVV